ncbi:DUF4180 domain-containing protein [Saccharicrinis sp. FJH62]|uniref:DUF4180 domain-containing protein n=1 Tax=Saccharicrinis sp. FJH62 TaxID=3344657 RepID=UPI0035D3FCF5
MKIHKHKTGEGHIAEVESEGIVINSAEDALNLLGNMYYQGIEKIILHQKNITNEFFKLKNGMAGEILQKFSNYRMRLAIVGDFTKYDSKSLNDFIRESNKNRHINFVGSLDDALSVLN